MKAVDPVCGMEVDISRTMYKTVYKGKIYYFCSSACKKEFERDPEYYLKHGPRGMPGGED
ncbi:MAG: YHS domain-containing protein [Sulfolobales archaeon]